MTDDIISLSEKFKAKTKSELQEYSNKQYETIVYLTKKNAELEQEVKHLKELLTNGLPAINNGPVTQIIKTPELAIIEAQIDILQNRALQKELNLEEIKCLDLLIKNKRLLTEQPTTINGDKKSKKIPEEAELVLIASQTKKQ